MDSTLDYNAKKYGGIGSFRVSGNGDVFEPMATHNADDKGEERVILLLSSFVFPILIY